MALIVLIALAGALFAGHIVYDRSNRPRLSLGSAYERAMLALGSATNQFHCTGASLDIALSRDGEWLFEFWTTNGTPKWITVEFDGKTHIANIYSRN